MEKQFIFDAAGNRTGVILSMEEYNNLLNAHQTSLTSINAAKMQLDRYLEFYAIEDDLEKFKNLVLKRISLNASQPGETGN